MSKEQDQCRFCHQNIVLLDDFYIEIDNQIELAHGGWTTLYIGVDENGKTVMRACGDNYTDNYYPKYCPECGRQLHEEETKK